MTEEYEICNAKGSVRGRWVSGPSVLDVFEIDNMMSYSAASALAAAYGGDTSGVPKYVGFLYGTGDPASLPIITRDMDWQYVRDMAEAVNGNVQVVNFNRKPSVCTVNPSGEWSNDQDGANESNEQGPYRNNVVEFHAITRSGFDGSYGEDVSGNSRFAGPLTSGDKIFRAVLLGDGNPCGSDDRYVVLAMVDMAKSGVYREKPEDYELAIDWRVTFK